MEETCKIPALYCEQDKQQQLVLLCRSCRQSIEQKQNLENSDQDDNQERQLLKQLEQQYDQTIKGLLEYAENLDQYSQQVQESLTILKQQFNQHLYIIIEKKEQVSTLSNSFTTLNLNDINIQENTLKNQLIQIKEQLINQLKYLEASTNLNQLKIDLNILQIEKDSRIKQKVEQNQIIKYQTIEQLSYKQNEWCCAIDFNKETTIMIAGCNNQIKTFEFNHEGLKENSQLNGHQYCVFCLKYLKKSNQIISTSYDSTIIIWEQNQNNQRQYNQILKNHTSAIYCIELNQNEDIMISGSLDCQIIFWQKQNNSWSSQQQINCQSYVLSINLNNTEDTLIASVQNKQILIVKLQNKEWKIVQKIQVEKHGGRLCFINSNEFVYQPFDEQHLLIFVNDQNSSTFKQQKQIKYQEKASDANCLFPIRYISYIGLLLVKNDHHLHLIKRYQDGQYQVQQSINFGTNNIYGNITDDGTSIVTWDDKSQQIQIRKLQD